MANSKRTNRYKAIVKEGVLERKATKHLSFGLFVFVIIFIYLVFVMVTFAIKEKVNYTTAEIGVLTHSNTYKGLILRNEKVIQSKTKGAVRYFLTEGSRVRNGNNVAGVLKNTDMIQRLDEAITKENRALPVDNPIFDESYDYLKNKIRTYVINKHLYKYEHTYLVKKQIMNNISDIRNTVIRTSSIIEDTDVNPLILEDQYQQYIDYYPAPESGLISYNIDGFEDITKDTFSENDLKRRPVLQATTKNIDAAIGQPLFKVVDNYLWYVVAEIDHECKFKIKDKTYISVEFIEKNIQIDARVLEIQDKNNKVFLILEIDRMLNKFLSERFTQFRLVYDEYEGIKIPESAVATRIYAQIPIDYLQKYQGEYVVNKMVVDDENEEQYIGKLISFNSLKVEKDFVYIPLSKELAIGDQLIGKSENRNDVKEKFELAITKDLEGVYVVNKGFAQFKLIETRYHHVDYRIVEPNTPYGIRIYDRIASEASTTKDYQMIN